MKKSNAIAWLITMLMTLAASPAFATDWGSENVTMQVGETKTLYLPSSVTTKTLKSVAFYSASWNDVEVLSYTNYSVKVKALKATTTPATVRCDYYYYINYGGYTYLEGGAYDFLVTVKGETTVKPTNISIPSTSSVKVGGSFYFVPSVTPTNATYTLTWDSSDNSIASVNQSGMLTGISSGIATITVTTDNGKSATCKVTVTAKSPTSVSLKSSLSLEVGDTYTLTPTVTPSDAETSYSWSSDNSGVATVSQYGVVTAKSAGTANITVKTDNGKTATCEVIVNANTANVTEYEVSFSIYGYEHGQVLYNGAKLAGNVTPGNGSIKVTEGSDVALTILPDNGYTIEWVWIDWDDVSSQIVNNVLTIHDIRGNKDLVVSFEEKEDDEVEVFVPKFLYCNIGEGGYVISGISTIMGENKIGVGEGDDITIKIVANEGYHIDSVVLDGVDVISQMVGNELSVKNMTEDRYLTVSFEKDNQVPEVPVVTTEDILTLGEVTAYTGTTVAFPISLTNTDDITALQMDLHLPTGITLATDEEGDLKIEPSSRVSSKHTIDCNVMVDGSYRIICYSTKNATFTGNSGELFNMVLNISADIADGNYEIMATNIELSDNTGTAHTCLDVKGKVTVKSYMLGDTDNNGKHTINDVVCIINHILNQPNAVFIEAAADLDGNGKITVNDAVQLISTYILRTTSNAPKATRAAEVSNEENFMSIEDVIMRPSEVKTIEVIMTNEREDIKGVQCDITLPQGISFLYDEEAEDYVSASSRIPKKLTLSSGMQDANTLRVAGVCTGSSSIFGNTGSVFSFKVKADESIEAGIYEIQLTNVELSYGEAIEVADRSSALEILEDVSEVTTLTTDEHSKSGAYDLNGHRIDASKTMKGFFIVNRKKVYIK